MKKLQALYEESKKTGILNVSDMKLTMLPTLPDSIIRLNCSHNQLTTLPELPETLTGLNCYNNQLTSLSLPDALTELYCSYNTITTLTLPESLTHLYCNNNRITSLSLPDSLVHLYCQENQLTSLPLLPESLQYVRWNKNPWNAHFTYILNTPDPFRVIHTYYTNPEVYNYVHNRVTLSHRS